MPRSYKFSLPKASISPLRITLGLLLVANLVAAAFVFHLFDAAPDALRQQLTVALSEQQPEQARLMRSRLLASSIDRGKAESDKFLATYLTTRRYTYSTIIGEITDTARAAGMDKVGATIAPLDAIQGSDDLDMMSISVNLEGNPSQLVKFVNLLDRSPRLLIIETLTATPRAKTDILTVNIKLDTFVREEKDGIS